MRIRHDETIRRTAKVAGVEQRLKEAFPEIDIQVLAEKSSTLNEHNLREKWGATVRALEYWVNLVNQEDDGKG